MHCSSAVANLASLGDITARLHHHELTQSFKKLRILTSMGRAGTSACVHGKFYCRNRGYTPQLLNASMVDDGFCGRLSLITPASAKAPAAGACMRWPRKILAL